MDGEDEFFLLDFPNKSNGDVWDWLLFADINLA